MAISRPAYCTREQVKRALDYKETSRSDAQVDRAIEAAADDVDGLMHRRFFPQLTTRYFDWPDGSYAVPWRLWFDSNELISVTTVVTGGVTLAPGDYFLRRGDDLDEPPYTYLEINLAGDAAFGGGPTTQRDIAITGLYGHSANETPAGALAEALDAAETGVDIADAGLIGVGGVIRVDAERMLVTGRRMLDTGQDLAGDLTTSAAAATVPVADGTAYDLDEVILIDAERMLIVDVAGNNLIVKRAWDGSTLAAHTSGADIYAPRTLLVERGALGTTAATHTSGTAIARHVVPGLVRDLAVAEALEQLLQESSGYARRATTSNSGSTSTTTSRSSENAAGAGIDAIRDRAYAAYGRKARTRAV